MELEQHSLGKSIVLHFMPGVISVILTILAHPLILAMKLPPFFGLLIVGIPAIILCHYGWLLYEARKKNGSFSMQGIVLYRERIPFWQYLVFIPLLFVLTFVIMAIFQPLDNFLKINAFFWIPEWLYNMDFNALTPGLRSISVALWVVMGVVIGPIVQEMYFRGYLLPRISRLGNGAPVLNTILFSMMHLFTPWQWISAALAFLLPSYVVYRKRNIYLGILLHCLLNIPSGLIILGIIKIPV